MYKPPNSCLWDERRGVEVTFSAGFKARSEIPAMRRSEEIVILSGAKDLSVRFNPESFQRGDHRGSELGSRGGSAHVARERFAFAVDTMQRAFNASRRIHFADVIEHHDAAHQQRGGIRDALARNVWRCAVNRFEDCHALADISAG